MDGACSTYKILVAEPEGKRPLGLHSYIYLDWRILKK